MSDGLPVQEALLVYEVQARRVGGDYEQVCCVQIQVSKLVGHFSCLYESICLILWLAIVEKCTGNGQWPPVVFGPADKCVCV